MNAVRFAVASCCAAGALLVVEPARAQVDEVNQLVALGGSLSGATGASSGFHQSLELTLGFFTVHETIPALSIGTIFREGRAAYMYGEASILLPVFQVTGPSVGLGAGAQQLPGRSAAPAVHVFLGLPSPPIPVKYFWPYLEPYCRPQMGLGRGGFVFEAGVMLKFVVTNGDDDFSN